MNSRLYKYELKPFFSCGKREEDLYLYNEKGNVIETHYYIGGYEVFRKETNNALDFERKTLNISDDEKVFVRIEQKTGETEVVRYQYSNHLWSACLELDFEGQIISYEEFHPFGTSSYKSGRNEIEVSLKYLRYNGKERDEETGLYAYGMRYYAAWICRFISTDPLQFKYPEYTPFQYAGNKPITFIDLDGVEECKYNKKNNNSNGGNEKSKTTQRQMDRVNKKLDEKIKTPLSNLEQSDDVSSTEIKDFASSLAQKYQNKKWFRTFFTSTNTGTKTVIPRRKREKKGQDGWIAKDYITINPYYSFQTKTYTSPAERPDSEDLLNVATTNLIATPESNVSIKFDPYDIPNSITVYTINPERERTDILPNTGMFAKRVLKENILMKYEDESVAGEIHYEVENTLEHKFADNWELMISVSTPVFSITGEIRQIKLKKYRPNLRSFRNKINAPM